MGTRPIFSYVVRSGKCEPVYPREWPRRSIPFLEDAAAPIRMAKGMR